VVQSQPGQIVLEILSQKISLQKRAGGVAQGVGPEFKPQYYKNKIIIIKFTPHYSFLSPLLKQGYRHEPLVPGSFSL
jgi:hypothetical protein